MILPISGQGLPAVSMAWFTRRYFGGLVRRSCGGMLSVIPIAILLITGFNLDMFLSSKGAPGGPDRFGCRA